MALWKNLSPYTLVEPDNPVFQRDHRRLRWLKTPESLLNYSLIAWIGIPALILLCWLIERTARGFNFVPRDMEDRLLNVVLIVCLGIMILSNFYIVITTIGRIHKQFHAGDWQSLRMTNQSEEDILAAKKTISQLQAWPLISLEIGLRAACIVIFILSDLYSEYRDIYPDVGYFTHTVLLSPSRLFGYGLMLVISFAFIFEPLLRMRVMIVWSTAIALQVREVSLALLTGFASVLIFLLIQVMLAAGLIALITDSTSGGSSFLLPLFCLSPILLYWFFTFLLEESNNFIRRKAFTQD